MKKQSAWLSRIRHLLGYKDTDDIPINMLLENTIDYYENIIACMPGNVYWMDKNCIALGGNQNVLDMFGLTLSQFQGLSFEEMGEISGWSATTTASFKHDTLDVINTGNLKLNVEEPPIIDQNGRSIIFLTHRVPLFDKQKNIIGSVGISIDITDRKKMERALHDEKIKSEAANHAKTEFIANMSHDIRTPLTGVVGMSKMIEDAALDPNQKKYAHMLGESGDQLLHMLNDILDVVSADNANDNDLHDELFDLRLVINDILQLERPTTLLKGIDLIVQVDEAVPPCLMGDHTKLHRILLNLVGNAIKFTAKGRVNVDVTCLSQTDTHALFQFRVADTGIGIPPELQDKVFDRFFRVTPSHKTIYTGHGVGLHIAQSYAHLLGGEIMLTSRPGVGTTFYFELSIKVGDAAILTTLPLASTKTFINAATLPTDAPHLLLIEDNPIALCALENLVTGAGCRVTCAMDGERGLELAKTQPFDLIITDLGLPGISGSEMTTLLRAFEMQHQKKPVPVIGLTAHADANIKEDCIQTGMNEALTKPMRADVFDIIKATYLSSNASCLTPVNTEKPVEHAGKLGVDLPDTEEALFLLTDAPLLDAHAALKSMNNDANVFNGILKSIVETELPKDLIEIEGAHAQGDWDLIAKIAHRMKGGFVYCGIARLALACQYLERYHKAGSTAHLEALYQQVRTVANDTTATLKRWLSMQ